MYTYTSKYASTHTHTHSYKYLNFVSLFVLFGFFKSYYDIKNLVIENKYRETTIRP